MSLENPTSSELSEVTLAALINSLKMHCHNLDQIFKEFEANILDNKLSGSNPHFKLASIKHLKNYIDDAKSNSLL